MQAILPHSSTPAVQPLVNSFEGKWLAQKFNRQSLSALIVGGEDSHREGRRLAQRVLEHKRAVRQADFNLSALAEHSWTCDHPVDWCNVQVLSNARDHITRVLQEAVFTDDSLNSLQSMTFFSILTRIYSCTNSSSSSSHHVHFYVLGFTSCFMLYTFHLAAFLILH